jgi:hypothetical protein
MWRITSADGAGSGGFLLDPICTHMLLVEREAT